MLAGARASPPNEAADKSKVRRRQQLTRSLPAAARAAD